MRKAMKNTIFGTALVAALMAAGTAANAQRPGFNGRGFDHPIVREGFRRDYVRPVGPEIGFGVNVGAPVYDSYIPPCPGDGYDWTAGYYNGGVWFPGAWRLRAGYVGRNYAYGRGYDRGYDRGFNRGNEREYARGFAHGNEHFGRR